MVGDSGGRRREGAKISRVWEKVQRSQSSGQLQSTLDRGDRRVILSIARAGSDGLSQHVSPSRLCPCHVSMCFTRHRPGQATGSYIHPSRVGTLYLSCFPPPFLLPFPLHFTSLPLNHPVSHHPQTHHLQNPQNDLQDQRMQFHRLHAAEQGACW